MDQRQGEDCLARCKGPAAADDATVEGLGALAKEGLFVVPLMLVYTVISYRVFHGKVTPSEHY